MQRHTPFTEGEYYHVYNRGVDKRKIFFTNRDWKVFQWMLFARNSNKRIDIPSSLGDSWRTVEREDLLVDICAYSLMPNHFHLLVKENQEGGISKFMSKLLTSFSMYMNKKYDRTGPLMCRPFRAKHVGTDEHFRWLVSYIHANPIELVEENWKEKLVKDPKGAAQHLNEYVYSSYYDYFVDKERKEGLILSKEELPFPASEFDSVQSMVNHLAAMEE